MNLKHQIDLILHSSHSDPFHVLGAHPVEVDENDVVAVRAFLPEAKEVSVIDPAKDNKEYLMNKLHKEGFFEVIIYEAKEVFPYKLKKINHDGSVSIFHDPYSFLPVLTDFDLHLMGEGTHYKKYEKLGAHLMTINNIKGVFFAVWAPNALRVSVIGDFNNWDGRRHPMRSRGLSGIWELFIPELDEGTLYKFEVKSKYKGYLQEKADPYAFYSELRPKSSSVVHSINRYKWNDEKWMNERKQKDWLSSPISVYEIHLGSWGRVPEENNRWLTYRELADELIPYVLDMGYTHIELLPVSEHPLDESWGYQTIGYYSCTSRFGKPEDFMYFIDQCHQNGIGIIIDWVPAHFPKDAHGLGYFDGTALYEHEDPRRGEQKEWGTLIFNYGRNEVANFLIANAVFWLDKYHIDGLRVDAVASMLYLDYSREKGEWITNQYGGNENLEAVALIKRFNEVVHRYHPGVLTIAEESTAWPMVSRPTYLGGLGFSLKWNMGWMHDILEYFSKDPIHRKHHQNNLTFALLYAFTENFILVLSHDEVVYGKCSLLNKMPGDMWQKFANLRLLHAYMYAQPGKKLIFMGGEIGQWSEWVFSQSLDWHLLQYEPHKKFKNWIKDLNDLYKKEPSMYEIDFNSHGFEWIDFGDYEGSIVSFIRKGKDIEDFTVFVFNFTPVPRYNYRIGVPKSGHYKEVLNSDSERYWGSNVGNLGGVNAKPIRWHGRNYSIRINLPPLGALIFKLL
ncbi:MAG: 1,4-alpha-glucan branching enzyme [Candidatus Schekmanbacteria bacterium RIFCSPHIGHO2_02_FULL_38_11]|uniref:1,4-alpha-glucan branching enzyme GlgB n=1 Tax=Candidatus Schekmanbacteria bacterium RIFCSPLOWO2_12_FULL_38_15 TaxID=1817883 RepID=A0A1F7SFQ0_9BACT|nr:MAG: 1,4-alpha-glucan branching enzyme [Candidatus Schekmanbacteria bacterium RIFCSPLOWO2_02_FULL_38_14]OGL50154.1 MAG: 1,4-alpha-glucan branching enzyme [Candidatus Schekmanbacteria bacterium RIFCSPHIGHO2_02_FULL_38_11]OGL52589.1 MAG: 1,4-alpha-glucan branching enzyme [Candidatus Schekmanbacteria bacterium RIFCSPLOWO2_12_FULL_38_15]